VVSGWMGAAWGGTRMGVKLNYFSEPSRTTCSEQGRTTCSEWRRTIRRIHRIKEEVYVNGKTRQCRYE